MAPEQTTEELLEAFLHRRLKKADAFYQDGHNRASRYKKHSGSGRRAVIMLVLPELLENTAALECYSDDTSRTTLLYCLLKDTLKDETFCWDSDSYRWLSDMLAEYIQFASWHALQGDEAYFDEYAPLMGFFGRGDAVKARAAPEYDAVRADDQRAGAHQREAGLCRCAGGKRRRTLRL